jgi:beta-glucosidase
VTYAEGVFLGYRYYTSMHKEPLYPFGYGLTYTTFGFSNLKVAPVSGTDSGHEFNVSFDVKNTGQRKGVDVAQVYVGDPSAKVKRPAKELKAFRKLRLQPGQSEHVTLPLDQRSLSYYDVNEKTWRIDPGVFQIFLGDSSANTPLAAEFSVTK